ncbi:GlxA family transcriptional regulator [Pseudomonas putida]|jgi:transcriptional regulator GlxA family with amidase domain|uniref:GlxA family transcriptional regulator n=1 Tax=Pseudomonas TaxID=286 RepID=UPI0023DE9D42|nr:MULTISPECIES: GlxA family transcriptional regulator [Pseudomonas]EKT4469624.1 GlxA family transcriptional regulator [Pseudomonas putida]MDF3171639.1 GlxA family transcriptional regulator [Pseudomonas sp. ER28]MDH1930651.1 GlxA family transcriptional regulator [Pseudomonas sp. GD03696]MDY7072453.1 HTH-type transcriptional regulator CdhR [Pseudomonas hunanensis]HDS0927735.1 GlxA family transcriptional regulator [Pseudomonas putida]
MHRVGYLLTEGFQIMSLATQTVFEFANIVAGKAVYRLENFSVGGGTVRSSLGMSVETLPLAAPGLADTWMVTGTLTPLTPPGEEVLASVRGFVDAARRTAGLCTGCFVLAQAGVLDGRRATTHWAYANKLRELHPKIDVEEDRIFIVDGSIWTSAGMTAALDMALGMVEKDLGNEMARSVAHKMVMHQRRSGGQSQHSELLSLSPRTDRIQSALDYARGHLSRPLSVEELAQVAHLSPRQFTRVFTAETGQSPAKAIEGLRLEAARLMIEQSRHSLEVVAKETGFRDRRHMREVFIRGFGVPPQAVRRDARQV